MHEEINLKNITNKYKIIPKKHLGQNFIFDQNILNKIVKNILPIKKFNIIEIGPGPGGLTLAILIPYKRSARLTNAASSAISDASKSPSSNLFKRSLALLLSVPPYY